MRKIYSKIEDLVNRFGLVAVQLLIFTCFILIYLLSYLIGNTWYPNVVVFTLPLNVFVAIVGFIIYTIFITGCFGFINTDKEKKNVK